MSSQVKAARSRLNLRKLWAQNYELKIKPVTKSPNLTSSIPLISSMIPKAGNFNITQASKVWFCHLNESAVSPVSNYCWRHSVDLQIWSLKPGFFSNILIIYWIDIACLHNDIICQTSNLPWYFERNWQTLPHRLVHCLLFAGIQPCLPMKPGLLTFNLSNRQFRSLLFAHWRFGHSWQIP